MKNQSLLAQSGSFSSDGGRSRFSASINPDSLIPSRMAILVSQYAKPQNSPNISDSTSSTRQSIPAISISDSSVVAAEPTASACTPPVENSEAPSAFGAEDGQGVCTFVTLTYPPNASNLDKTRRRIVRKGVTCDWSGLRIRIQRVRLGIAYGETFYAKNPVIVDCAQLRVVA